ncbi:hypothetical protein I4U23_019194 [Adineta vaga]|nr:hypothetical protein I4U23_019194 [Adineta vaga]
MTSQKVYRILAFGDSLTEGFHFAGFRFHPYAIKLAELVRNHCEWVYDGSPDRPQIEVKSSGRSNECVLSGMLDRFRKTLSDAVEEGHYYRWIIILGGIHDLAYGIKPETIFDGLRQMYQLAYEHGANLVIMTINETGRLKTNDPRDLDRHTLNTLIKKYAWENHYAGGRRTFCVDINEAIPWHRPDLEEKKQIWDDHMHLTPKGYDLIGTLIFQTIVDYLNLKDI